MAAVDETAAAKKFTDAVARAKKPDYAPHSKLASKIKSVVGGTHLTYRYILVTGLLAKATNPKVNAICLQAGARLEGAYDARSLCHGVVVPMERNLLNNCLGGSNEPYLNKPARFTHLSTSNAVRAGQDTATLKDLIAILSSLANQAEATSGLEDAIYYGLQRQVKTANLQPITEASHSRIKLFGEHFLARSVEGQTLATFFGTLLTCVLRHVRSDLTVIVHPINQSGASSREVCDVDVKDQEGNVAGYEIKDKAFNASDVEHAASKARGAGLAVLGFVLGPQARLASGTFDDARDAAQRHSVDVLFSRVPDIATALLSLAPRISAAEFLDELKSVCGKARVKDEVYSQIEIAAVSSGLAKRQ